MPPSGFPLSNWMVVVVRNRFPRLKVLQVHPCILSISVSSCSSDCTRVSSAGRLTIWIFIESLRRIIHAILWYSKSCDYNQDEYDRWNAMWLRNPKNHCCESPAPTLPQSCKEVSAACKVSWRSAQRSHLLQKLTILAGASENALVESERTLLSSRGAWEHLEVLRSTGAVDWSVWEFCVCLPDRFTFRWCSNTIYTVVNNLECTYQSMAGKIPCVVSHLSCVPKLASIWFHVPVLISIFLLWDQPQTFKAAIYTLSCLPSTVTNVCCLPRISMVDTFHQNCDCWHFFDIQLTLYALPYHPELYASFYCIPWDWYSIGICALPHNCPALRMVLTLRPIPHLVIS